MMKPTMTAVEFDRTSSGLTIYLAGELDCATTSGVADQIVPRVGRGEARVWVDLAAVTFCGSAGLSLFIQLERLVRRRGGQITFYAPAPPVMRAIEICGLDHVLSIARPPVRRGTAPLLPLAPLLPAVVDRTRSGPVVGLTRSDRLGLGPVAPG